MEKIKAIKIKDDIFWTGVLDPDIEVFDIIMRTEHGTTYNSYLIKGKDKTALIEIAKETFFDEFIERLEEVCDPTQIDYIITNHTEPDHSGSLARLLKLNPNAQVVGSQTAIKFLRDIVNEEFNEYIVKDGDTLDLGGKTLKFIYAPFLHWPDSMYTYCVEDKILFSCDSFGCHYCTKVLFNDAETGDFMPAYRYYFDVIMGPFKSFVLKAIDTLEKNNIEIDMICPGHGPILRENPKKYIELYREWATPEVPEKPSLVIAYVSSYGYTKSIAQSIAEGAKSLSDIEVNLFDLESENIKNVMNKIEYADGVLVGSPTIVGDTLPPVWALLTSLNPVIHKGKIAGAFGSYGWSGEAITNIEQRFSQLRMKMPLPSLKIVFRPNDSELASAYEFGEQFAKEVDKNYKSKYNK